VLQDEEVLMQVIHPICTLRISGFVESPIVYDWLQDEEGYGTGGVHKINQCVCKYRYDGFIEYG